MTEMINISEAVLKKVGQEAERIVEEAEAKSLQEMRKAEKQLETRREEEKRRALEKAERDANRVMAEAAIQSRQEIGKTKARIIDRIVSEVKNKLSNQSVDKDLLRKLVIEAIDSIGTTKVKVYVSPQDETVLNEVLKSDQEIAKKVIKVQNIEGISGVIVESDDGKLRVDNTFETRLAMLLPQVLPEINKKLFDSGQVRS
jgi:V/A-type H+-transporting ATPase subunit E